LSKKGALCFILFCQYLVFQSFMADFAVLLRKDQYFRLSRTLALLRCLIGGPQVFSLAGFFQSTDFFQDSCAYCTDQSLCIHLSPPFSFNQESDSSPRFPQV